MPLIFYYGSGSPFAWKVWLTLEHKALPYEQKLLSFDAGDLARPEYLAVNPRGRVPAIVDDGFALWESSAIVEYLEERYPERPVLPAELRARARARRVAAEADHYLYPAVRKLLALGLRGDASGARRAAQVHAALQELGPEIARFVAALGDQPFFAGTLSVADFACYPHLRMLRRLDERQPQHRAGRLLGPDLSAWMARVEELPYFATTLPPHWKG
ncbi:MAG: glutathione S-transferase family protein [Polyangiaceae bacterium]|nr:glutathione S-transferase family protein [Polyangiaceae bacterium]